MTANSCGRPSKLLYVPTSWAIFRHAHFDFTLISLSLSLSRISAVSRLSTRASRHSPQTPEGARRTRTRPSRPFTFISRGLQMKFMKYVYPFVHAVHVEVISLSRMSTNENEKCKRETKILDGFPGALRASIYLTSLRQPVSRVCLLRPYLFIDLNPTSWRIRELMFVSECAKNVDARCVAQNIKIQNRNIWINFPLGSLTLEINFHVLTMRTKNKQTDRTAWKSSRDLFLSVH